MKKDIITPQTHPDHHTVGRFLDGAQFGREGIIVFYCDSYDPSCGYWLTDTTDPKNRINVSERAIDRTFHTIHRNPDGSGWSQWRNKIPFEAFEIPVITS